MPICVSVGVGADHSTMLPLLLRPAVLHTLQAGALPHACLAPYPHKSCCSARCARTVLCGIVGVRSAAMPMAGRRTKQSGLLSPMARAAHVGSARCRRARASRIHYCTTLLHPSPLTPAVWAPQVSPYYEEMVRTIPAECYVVVDKSSTIEPNSMEREQH